MATTQIRKQPRPPAYDVAVEDDDDAIYDTRIPSSARRYQPLTNTKAPHRDAVEEPVTQAIPAGTFIQRRRASSKPNVDNGTASKAVAPTKLKVQHRRHFPLVLLFLGMVGMGLLVVGLTNFGTWWQIHQDDVQYGRPRTSQINAVVGHGDSAANPTHFIFINLNRHVEIIEFPGGDGTHAHVYSGPVLYGNGQDLTPVTGEVRDVNGDGKPDLIVHIGDQKLVLINTGDSFRPQQPGDQVNL